jgi:hypothetical protein
MAEPRNSASLRLDLVERAVYNRERTGYLPVALRCFSHAESLIAGCLDDKVERESTVLPMNCSVR